MDRKTVIVALIAVEIVIVVAAAQAIRAGTGASWGTPDAPAPVTTTLNAAAGPGRLAAVSLPGAAVMISPSTDGGVHVVAHTEMRHWGWSSGLRRVPIHIDPSPDGVHVWRDAPPPVASFGWSTVTDTIDVSVPAAMAVDVTSAARIVASGMRAALKLHSHDGSIRVDDQEGDLALSSDSGRIYLDRVTANAVRIRTAYGRIVADGLSFRGTAPQFDALTQNGRLELAMKQLPADGRYIAHTQNGRVRLHLAAGTDATVTMKTGDGKISATGVSLSGQGNERRAVLGDGRAPFDVSTQNGSIALWAGSTE